MKARKLHASEPGYYGKQEKSRVHHCQSFFGRTTLLYREPPCDTRLNPSHQSSASECWQRNSKGNGTALATELSMNLSKRANKGTYRRDWLFCSLYMGIMPV